MAGFDEMKKKASDLADQAKEKADELKKRAADVDYEGIKKRAMENVDSAADELKKRAADVDYEGIKKRAYVASSNAKDKITDHLDYGDVKRKFVDIKTLVRRMIGWTILYPIITAIPFAMLEVEAKDPSGIVYYILFFMLIIILPLVFWHSTVRISGEKIYWGGFFGLTKSSVNLNEIETTEYSSSAERHSEVRYNSMQKKHVNESDPLINLFKWLFGDKHIVTLYGKFGTKKIVFGSVNPSKELLSFLRK